MSKKNRAPLRVMELFAGVGGFRLGLEACSTAATQAYEVVWSNQWEPSTRSQHASDIYAARFGARSHSNEDLFKVVEDDTRFAQVIDAAPEMLVGGFPCQDYSVAASSNRAEGLEGKKGVLWWAIHTALAKLSAAGKPVQYLLLENVDRLIKSPSKATGHKGGDFSVILASLSQLGYAVEWRVVNAADHGFAQRRKRTFMVAYHQTTGLHAAAATNVATNGQAAWLTAQGVLGRAFPADLPTSGTAAVREFALGANAVEAQSAYRPTGKGHSMFENAGLMLDGVVHTARTTVTPTTDYTRYTGCRGALTLADVVNGTKDVPPAYYIADDDLARWSYLKGAKSGERVAANGFTYKYAEGAIPFPDPLDRPSRTLITGEGGTAPSRTKHVVRTTDGRLRRLVPEELEALNGFPRGFTQLAGVSDAKRAFVMGNAMVVGVVTAIGRALGHLMAQHDGPPYGQPSGASDVVDALNGAPPASACVSAYAAICEHLTAEVTR